MRVLVNHVASQSDLARADKEIQKIRTRLRRLERRRVMSRWFQRTFAQGFRQSPAAL